MKEGEKDMYHANPHLLFSPSLSLFIQYPIQSIPDSTHEPTYVFSINLREKEKKYNKKRHQSIIQSFFKRCQDNPRESTRNLIFTITVSQDANENFDQKQRDEMIAPRERVGRESGKAEGWEGR